MKDNDKDEYFQNMELDKINKNSKQKVNKTHELIRIKEWNITHGDVMSK